MAKVKGEWTGDRSAIVYVAAAAPWLLLRLSVAYLRMRRRANKEGRQFYQALLRDGVPREHARMLADEYSSSLSLVRMIRENLGKFTS
ncbi:MAG: hypothetical protein NT131_00880 [Methanomassiliicoccales archaeon]|nr:hypothetical protein [Methanomassiliicoccales archaeon]